MLIADEPIVLQKYNKVAYDVAETAEVVCKVQAYPKPEFKWFYGSNTSPLHSSSEGHYIIHTSMEDNDMYTSVLRISNIKQHDYGDYNCQVVNNLGSIVVKIRLQPKGPPEKPTHVAAVYSGSGFVTLNWEPGFNGGITNTKYFVSYRKVPGDEDEAIEGCGMVMKSVDWLEVDCQQNVPCNVTHLEQHQPYSFKVKALNTKGSSENSHEIRASTKVDRIPVPQRVAYDPASHTLSINVPPTCLPLMAVVESIIDDHPPIPSWQVIDTLPLQVSGIIATYKEANLEQLRNRRTSGRALVDEPIGVNDDIDPRIRVRLCLRTHHELCGDFVEAECEFLDNTT